MLSTRTKTAAAFVIAAYVHTIAHPSRVMIVVMLLGVPLLAFVAFFVWARRTKASGGRIAAAQVTFSTGFLTAWLIFGHLSGVVNAVRTHTQSTQWLAMPGLTVGPFRYDLVFYWLMLMGVVILRLALGQANAATRLLAGNAGAWRQSVRPSLMLLGVCLPLAPFQSMGIVLGVLAGVNALAMVPIAIAERRRERRVPRAEPMPRVADDASVAATPNLA